MITYLSHQINGKILTGIFMYKNKRGATTYYYVPALNLKHAAMVSEVGKVLGTLTYPHLILPYSAYYGHTAACCGGPRCSPIDWWYNKINLQILALSIYVKM